MFTPENVTPAGFSYTFADPTTRYNDIQVAFVNPDLGWEQDWRPATIDNTDQIAKFGRIPFQFVAVGPGGSSAPATATVQVVGRAPTARALSASTVDGQTVTIDLTDGVADGPFTAATVVSITPADQATARIVEGGTADARAVYPRDRQEQPST